MTTTFQAVSSNKQKIFGLKHLHLAYTTNTQYMNHKFEVAGVTDNFQVRAGGSIILLIDSLGTSNCS